MTRTVVATANVLGSLGRRDAAAVVAAVLDLEPDLVALQEWHPWRAGVLRRHTDYRWHQPLLGGCALGYRRSRYTVGQHGTRLLSPPGRADRSGRLLGLEPARVAAFATLRETATQDRVALVGYHLASQVQDGADQYRDGDRPRLVARHRREVATLERLVAGLRTDPARPATYACGDSNFHGLRLAGLVSAWDDRPEAGGTHGRRRQIDDIHAATAPADVRTVATASDHLAVVATYA